jgi:hypothetical protein
VVIGGGNETDEQVIVVGTDNHVNGEECGNWLKRTYIAPGLDNDVIAQKV